MMQYPGCAVVRGINKADIIAKKPEVVNPKMFDGLVVDQGSTVVAIDFGVSANGNPLENEDHSVQHNIRLALQRCAGCKLSAVCFGPQGLTRDEKNFSESVASIYPGRTTAGIPNAIIMSMFGISPQA